MVKRSDRYVAIKGTLTESNHHHMSVPEDRDGSFGDSKKTLKSKICRRQKSMEVDAWAHNLSLYQLELDLRMLLDNCVYGRKS